MSKMRGVCASLLAILGIVEAPVIVGLPLAEAKDAKGNRPVHSKNSVSLYFHTLTGIHR